LGIMGIWVLGVFGVGFSDVSLAFVMYLIVLQS